MIPTNLSETKKNLILSYLENVLEFDRESQLPEKDYFSLFEENMYRLVSFIAELTSEPVMGSDLEQLDYIFNKIIDFNKKKRFEDRKEEVCLYYHLPHKMIV